MRCPKDGSACCDDLCHGAGCLQMDGYAMLAECDVCGGLIDEEIPDCSTCTCDDEGDDYWPEDEDAPVMPNAELRGAEPAGGASLSNAVFGVED